MSSHTDYILKKMGSKDTTPILNKFVVNICIQWFFSIFKKRKNNGLKVVAIIKSAKYGIH